MKYVHKSNEKAANEFIDAYLDVAKEQPWYGARRLYQQFGSTPEKQKLINAVLMPEQECMCCYCMRHLPKGYGTIEHIIRQSIPDAGSMKSYFKPEFLGLNVYNVCHTDDYVKGRYIPGQYPHKVAYHNFAIACSLCNGARGDNDVIPAFLYPNIENEVVYDRRMGEVSWINDPELSKAVPTERPMVEKVGLNSSLLRAIRCIWLYGKDHPTPDYSTPDTVKTEEQKYELVYNAFGKALVSDKDFDMTDLNTYVSLLTDHLWNILLRYRYFGTI